MRYETVLDEPRIGTIMLIGNWEFTRFPNGDTDWRWNPQPKTKMDFCSNHSRPIYFYGSGCPACSAQATEEFMKLTESDQRAVAVVVMERGVRKEGEHSEEGGF